MGKSGNQCIHYDTPRRPQQGAVCHIEDDAAHILDHIRRLFLAWGRGRKSLGTASTADSKSVPPYDEVDWYKDKEDKDNPLTVLPSGSRGVTFTKYDISTLFCKGIVVEDENNPDLENVLSSEEVLPAPETLNLVFQGIEPCR